MKTYKSIFKAGFAMLFFFFFTSCNSGQNNTSHAEEGELLPEDIVELRTDQAKLADIQTGRVELRSLSATIRVTGIVSASPQNTATACVPMGGYIKNTRSVAGSAVSKGQVLATIENREFIDLQQNYLETKNKLDFAEAEYLRHNELYKNDVYSQKNVQQVTSEYKNLKTQLKALQEKLKLVGIKPSSVNENTIVSVVPVVAPIDGYVKVVNVNIGKYVAPSDILFEIVNNSDLFLELSLFEKDADKVSKGQNIRFFVNNESEEHRAQIYQTAKAIDTNKTYKVYAKVLGMCKNVLPGMYVNAQIETINSKVTSIPSEAIVTYEEKDYIFVVEKNKKEGDKWFTEYRMIQIEKGVSENGFTELKLPESFNLQKSKVVIKGAYNLLSAKKNAGEMAC